jgi:DHA1 family purine ribonucleoside efflux pump-like MFS transporter/DHA1 family bicyclomycin/chloramphenicol resistance-like MFS transporter
MSARRTSIIGGALATLGPISMSAYTPAMPQMMAALHTTEAAIKLSLSVYFGAFSVTQLVCGPLSDRFGRRPTALVFLAIYIAGGFVAAGASTVFWLVVGRLLQGIGASVGITVARAIVRDQFDGREAATVMNLIGMMLAIGPAIAPTLGSLALLRGGWEWVLIMLALFGVCVLTLVLCALRETCPFRDEQLVPMGPIASYLALIADKSFMAATVALGCAIGALYALATTLPFILIKIVGLSPTEFALGMLLQSGGYIASSIMLRYASPGLGGNRCVAIGLGLVVTAGLLMFVASMQLAPHFITIMGPVGLLACGLAFMTPHLSVVALAPFRKAAGSASAMMGFIQMGCGFAGSLVTSVFVSPVQAFGTVIPILTIMAGTSYLLFQRLRRA